MSDSELEGKVAIITGGATGIGLGSAVALAEAGAWVILFGPDAGALEAGVSEIGGSRASYVAGDVRQAEAVRALIATTPKG